MQWYGRKEKHLSNKYFSLTDSENRKKKVTASIGQYSPMKTSTLAIWSVATVSILIGSPAHLALAKRDPWSQNIDIDDSNHGHRTPSSSRVRYNRGEDVNSKVNLLIKYKPSSLQRVRASFLSNIAGKRLNQLASSVSNVSRRHKIARVEIDADDKDAVISELMNEDAVEMVEEVSVTPLLWCAI